MERRCLECNNVLIKLPTQKRLNPKRRFCNNRCCTRYRSRIYSKKNYDKSFLRVQKYQKKYYQIPKNKKRQCKNVMKNYYSNKNKWNQRGFTSTHRAELLKLINQKCQCGKEVKVIHHITYSFNLPKKRLLDKEYLFLLWEYSQFLIGFCSKACHRAYERKQVKLQTFK